jgi:hypothetical protein
MIGVRTPDSDSLDMTEFAACVGSVQRLRAVNGYPSIQSATECAWKYIDDVQRPA